MILQNLGNFSAKRFCEEIVQKEWSYFLNYIFTSYFLNYIWDGLDIYR